MPIRHREIEIPDEEPFRNCKLDRKKYADILTTAVKEYSDGFVLAINNEWGAGKTTFVKMWQRLLEGDGMKTIYLNAWENDFQLNPMTAILSELKGISKGSEDKFKDLLEKGKIIAKNTIPTILKGLIKKYIGIDEVAELAESATTAGVEIIESEIDEYQKKKEGLQHFRDSLQEFVASECPIGTPLIFIVDELDRCRPDYAVELLEHMKHFFNVPGVVFALSIDKGQLENSIKGFYGSDNLNAEEYLRRFIDIEFRMPEPNNEAFTRYLFDYFDFGKFFFIDERMVSSRVNQDPRSFWNFATLLFSEKKLNLRQQEKIFAHSRLALKSFKSHSYIFPEVFLFLTYIFLHHPGLFHQLQNRKLSIQDCVDKTEALFPDYGNNETLRTFLIVEAYILYFYFEGIKQINRNIRLITVVGVNNPKTIKAEFESRFKNHEEFGALINTIEWILDTREFNINIDYLLNRISLTEHFHS